MACSILIVDDSQTIREIVAHMLDMAELPIRTLHHAENGKAALDILRREWIDLVFLDTNMPVMSGLELIECMQRDELLATIPVVVLSTGESKSRVDRLLEKGVRAHLQKPFTPEKVKALLDLLVPVKQDA